MEEYDDVYEAFDEIKRPNSSVLTLRDFEQGLRTIRCFKFKGRREMEQVAGGQKVLIHQFNKLYVLYIIYDIIIMKSYEIYSR